MLEFLMLQMICWFGFDLKFQTYFRMEIAFTGHTWAHTPQPLQ